MTTPPANERTSVQSVSQRLSVYERVSQVVTEVGEGQELKLDEKITFQVRPEKIRFITYIWFWTMCIIAIILNNYIVKPRMLAGPPASWPPEQHACPPFQGGELYGVGEIAPGQGFDVSTESHLIRLFGYNNICSNWDYSPSREITAAYYPGFEYSLILYIILDFWVVTLHYKRGLVPRYFYLTFMIFFPFLILCSAWVRLIFVSMAYENMAAHTFGFLMLQIVLIAVACFEVWFIIAAKMEYRVLCGYTKHVALVLLFFNLIISSIKFYLTAYMVNRNEYPRWANTCDGELCAYPPGRIVDMIWMVFNAFIPLVSSFVRSLSEKPLEFTIDLASPIIKHVGWRDGEGGGWEDVEQFLTTDLSE